MHALVTGGLGILGRVISDKLVEDGWHVHVIDIADNKDNAGLDPENFTYHSVNLRNEREIEELIDLLSRYNLGAVVNNAATKTSSLEDFLRPLQSYKLSVWDEVFEVNVRACFLILRQVIRNNLKPVICNISSIYGINGPDSRIYSGSEYNGMEINTPLVYSTTKSAMIGYNHHIAANYAEWGIRSNVVCPGGIYSGQNDRFQKNYAQRVPMRRMAKVEEIAATVQFLVSERSSYLNGQVIAVDGGLTCT